MNTSCPGVRVALPLPLGDALSYALPDSLAEHAQPGCRVEVPVGHRLTIGVILDRFESAPSHELRDVLGVLDRTPSLNPELIALLQWVADYYMAPIGEVLKLALPPGLLSTDRMMIRLSAQGRALLSGLPVSQMPEQPPATRKALLTALSKLPATGVTSVSAFQQKAGRGDLSRLRQWEQWGLVELMTGRDRRSAVRTVATLAPAVERESALAMLGRAPAQAHAYERLCTTGFCERGVFCDGDPACARAVSELIKRGFIETGRQRVYRSPLGQHLLPERDGDAEARTLWPDQSAALADFADEQTRACPRPLLIYGEPGSGKTEVYLQLADSVLATGKTVLVLAPEIALTPQLVSRIYRRFGDAVAVLHSALSPGERLDEWQRIRTGEARIVVGARSAVFAPLDNIGLIVVDEEQDGSYKSDERVCFQGRDVAVMRGRLSNAPVVLGSGTPSVESIANAQAERYRLARMRNARARSTPELRLIDMGDVRASRRSQLSAELVLALNDRLERGEQSILFLNRRGWAPTLVCSICKTPVRCEHCAVTLTYHRTVGELVCHACGSSRPYPEFCPSCQRPDLELVGVGTQRVEDELELTFPKARIGRLDRDALTRRDSMSETLTRFERGELDILIGTQLVTKGHDFPNVTFVGVLNADISLNLPDFRAAERSFQILTQVAGRTGRGAKAGEVLIQTFQPRHFVLSCVSRRDGDAFYRQELEIRRGLYPPSVRLALLRLESPGEDVLKSSAAHLARRLRDLSADPTYGGIALLGPAPAPIPRVREHWRTRILLRSPNATRLHRFLYDAKKRRLLEVPRDVRLQIDIDPGDMM
jgi:primosomal protein N' (replication factor Y)